MRFLALATALLCTVPAQAADFSTSGRYVTINGNIEKQDARKFLDFVQDRREPTTVILNSNGGYIAEAAWISQIIRVRQWETSVMAGARCNSACPLMWLGGIQRSLHSRLGFHSAAKVPLGSGVRHEEANAFIGKFILQMGGPRELVELQPKADPCCFNYVDAAQAKAWGLLNPQQVTRKPDSEIELWLIGLRHHMEAREHRGGA